MAENFDVNLNDEVENFVVEFGEIQRITVDDFDKLRNRPSYNSQLMTHETNIPKVPANVSELNNDSDYQTGEEVAQALEAKQDKLTAGNNVQISEQNIISATDTVYSAGNGINIGPQNVLSVDTTVVATQQELSNEVHNRENADNYLQGQIDAISASSDVVDIVGTYADLQNYDTQHLKDNDIIKVLQDETQGNATTYYRWSTSTQTFTLIGQEGPYYTKAGADAQFVPQTRTVNGKALSSNITLDASDVSALGPSSVVQTTGNSTSQIMSQKATTDALDTKLNASDYVVDTQLADSDNPVQNRVLNGLLGDMPNDFFSGEATTTPTASTEVQFGNILSLDDVQLLGNTTQQTYSGKNLIAPTDLHNGSFTNYSQLQNNTYTETDSTKYRSVRIENLPAGTYTVSINWEYTARWLRICADGSVVTIGQEVNTYTFTTTTDGLFGITFRNTTSSNFSDDDYTIQIEAGFTATPYEPYVGGIPAPSPDYPQTVNAVTGVQRVTVSDKQNLVDIGSTVSGTINASTGEIVANTANMCGSNYISVTPNTTYTLSANIPFIDLRVNEYTNNKSNIQRISQSGTSAFTFTTSNNTYYVRWSANYNAQTISDPVATASSTQLWLNEGSQRAIFSTYTIDLGATELCKIGTYQDKIYKSGSDWYVHKETGTDSITAITSLYTSAGAGFIGAYKGNGELKANSRTDGYCDKLTPIYSPSGATTEGITFGAGLSSQNIYLILKSDRINDNTMSGWNTYLSSNPYTVYYPLATPTNTKITDATLISELEALLSASTYDGETNFVITATGTNLPAPLQLTVINANAKGLIERMRA